MNSLFSAFAVAEVIGANPILTRLLLASIEFAALAVMIAAAVKLWGGKRPRVVVYLWAIVLVKPLVSLVAGTPLPVFSFATVEPDSPRASHSTDPSALLSDARSEPLQSPTSPGFPRSAGRLANTSASAGDLEAARIEAPVEAPRMSADLAASTVTNDSEPYGFLDWIAGLWIVGCLGVVVWLLQGRRAAARLAACGTPASESLAAVYQALADELGIRRPPCLRVSKNLPSPALVGVIRPTILIPVWLAEDDSDSGCDILRWSLRHELTHFTSGDPLLMVLRDVVRAVFFFHPAAWWCGARLEEAIEVACDHGVVNDYRQATAYAKGLYELLNRALPQTAPVRSGGLFATRTQIGQRIASLLQGPLSFESRLGKLTIVTIVLFAATIFCIGLGTHSTSRADEQDAKPSGPADDLDADAVKEQVIAGIQSNYAALKTVRATIETLTLDPSVTERTEERIQLGGGGVATIVREPWSVDVSVVTLRGADLRSDPMGDPEGTVWTLVDGLWTQYVVNAQTAWVRRQDQMPGKFPIDPRDIGATELREPLLVQLQRSDVKSAEMAEGLLKLELQHADGRDDGRIYRCEVDPQKNFLPTKFEYLMPDGRPHLTMNITYQEVVDGIWLLREAERRFPISGQIIRIRTLGRPQVNEPITDEAFEMAFPEGTQIRDSVHSSIHRVGGSDQTDAKALTKIGDPVPAFTVTTLDGREIRSQELLGRTYVITFFATWCGPCLAELRQIEEELSARVKDDGLLILAIGREHTPDELRDFDRDEELTFAIAADPDREVYSRFASSKIPRTYIVAPDGKIVYQSVGYTYPRFQSFVEALERAIAAEKQTLLFPTDIERAMLLDGEQRSRRYPLPPNR